MYQNKLIGTYKNGYTDRWINFNHVPTVIMFLSKIPNLSLNRHFLNQGLSIH